MTVSNQLYQFEAAATNLSVDADKGVIYGVSLITSGVAARGHTVDHPGDKDQPVELRRKIGLEVDHTTLEQMLECATEKKKLPVKWNHKTGADAVSGYLKNFRIEGKKLVGDWHLLKSHERFNHAIELATEMPECLGLSTSFRGKDEVKNNRAFARCTELVSADLVASPAANPDGFFEERVDMPVNGMGNTANPTNAGAEQPSLADVLAGINQFNARFTAVEEKLQAFEEFQNALVNGEYEQEFEEQEEPEQEREFTDGADALAYLEGRLTELDDERERAKVERAFAVYESKVEGLLELNERLAAENAAMAEAIHEFSEQTGAVVAFSPGAEGGFVHELSIPDGHSDTTRKPTDFETACKQFEAKGMNAAEAVSAAIKSDRRLYQRHLQEIGVLARTL